MKNNNFIRSVFYLITVLLLTSSCKTVQNKNMTEIQPTNERQHEITYAVSYLNVVPLRSEASHRSEMVTQVLFGEYMEVLDTKDEWSFIKLEQDGYKGWIESSQLLSTSKMEYEKFVESSKVKVFDKYIPAQIGNVKVLMTKGTNLPFYADGFFIFNSQKIPFSGNIITGVKSRNDIVETAKSYLNTPYLWGGKTVSGIDCSGFSQMVYHLNGYNIDRDASLQAKQGELVAFLSQAQVGDLAFFDNKEGRITHVGIILENGKIIHAAYGKVHIDKLDQEGIFNTEIGKYTHHLRVIKRYF
jgi:hypothetical protein